MNWLTNKLKLIDKVIDNCLDDFKSLRVWLVLWAFVFNLVVLYFVAFHQVHYSVMITSIALLTAVYTYFFASKRDENKQTTIRGIDPDESI